MFWLVHSSFKNSLIHGFIIISLVSFLFIWFNFNFFGIIIQKNRMIQVASCEQVLR